MNLTQYVICITGDKKEEAYQIFSYAFVALKSDCITNITSLDCSEIQRSHGFNS